VPQCGVRVATNRDADAFAPQTGPTKSCCSHLAAMLKRSMRLECAWVMLMAWCPFCARGRVRVCLCQGWGKGGRRWSRTLLCSAWPATRQLAGMPAGLHNPAGLLPAAQTLARTHANNQTSGPCTTAQLHHHHHHPSCSWHHPFIPPPHPTHPPQPPTHTHTSASLNSASTERRRVTPTVMPRKVEWSAQPAMMALSAFRLVT
jgi:hypothetical protein